MQLQIIIKNFNPHNLSKLLSILKKSINIAKLDKKVIIECINTNEQDTFAFTIWPLKNGFQTPVVQLTNQLMEQDQDTIGYTLTHEFIHCKQGFWHILTQNFWHIITFKKGFPRFEIEAYDSINKWYDKNE